MINRASRRQSSRGSVFIVVLVICLGLVSLTLVFGHSMMMAYRGEETDLAGRQAEQALQGAARYVEYILSSGTTPGMLPTPGSYQAEAVPVGDANFWFIGEPPAGQVTDTPTFGLIDEASKLNLNTASAAMLENLPTMTQTLAEAIVQWRTAATSSSTSASAASSAGGSTSNNKGGQFESLPELLLVNDQNGGDPSVLYGDDLNLNHILDANENHGGGQFNPGVFEYTTVFSREPNTQSDGTPKVNVTNQGALTTVLRAAFGESNGNAIARRLTAGGPVRSVLEFYIRSGITEAQLDQLTPQLTMKGGPYAVGLINVNTASATVLQCVPGITQNVATQIVSARQNQATPSTNLAWLVPILGNAASIQAGPYLTTLSYQVTADVAAVGHYGRGYRRTLFVIDTSTGTPEIVYQRDMAALGWALGPTAMQTLALNKVTK